MTLPTLPKGLLIWSGKYPPVNRTSDCHYLQERLSLHAPQTTIIRALVLQQLVVRARLDDN